MLTMRWPLVVATSLLMGATSLAQEAAGPPDFSRNPQSPDIYELVIDDYSVSELPPFVLALDGLTSLHITKTQISNLSIKPALQYLRELTITENSNLNSVNDIRLPAGYSLNISNNAALTSIDRLEMDIGHSVSISKNESLEQITKCKFASVDDTIDIKSNKKLSKIACGDKFQMAAEIDLSNNALDDDIWQLLPDYPRKLWKLKLSNNPAITHVPETIAWSRINELLLSGTGITSVPNIIPYLHDLLILQLNNTCIDPEEYRLFYAVFSSKIKELNPEPDEFKQGAHCAAAASAS